MKRNWLIAAVLTNTKWLRNYWHKPKPSKLCHKQNKSAKNTGYERNHTGAGILGSDCGCLARFARSFTEACRAV